MGRVLNFDLGRYERGRNTALGFERKFTDGLIWTTTGVNDSSYTRADVDRWLCLTSTGRVSGARASRMQFFYAKTVEGGFVDVTIKRVVSNRSFQYHPHDCPCILRHSVAIPISIMARPEMQLLLRDLQRDYSSATNTTGLC